VGLAYQMQSAARKGVAFGPRYFRRLIGLLILGLLHVYFGFTGDILFVYGILGAIPYLFRDLPVHILKRWVVAFIAIQIVLSCLVALMLWAMESFAPGEMASVETEIMAELPKVYEGFRSPDFTTVAATRFSEWAGYLAFALPIQGVGVLGYFIWGLAIVKSGLISEPSHPTWSRARRVALPIGLIISACGAWMLVQAGSSLSSLNLGGMALVSLGAPLATIGYMGLFAKWATGAGGAVRTFFARAGTASLTVYLLQSLILSWVFSGYGLGLYGELGAAQCTLIAIVTGLATITFASFWRTRFSRGPFEWVLRKWTYLGAR
jgi:uncharacterized protein